MDSSACQSFLQKLYSEQITQQLDSPAVDLSSAELNPVDLSMAVVKEITGKWLVNRANHISNNPHFIVNGFVHSGASKALDVGAIVDLSLSEIR